MIWENEKQNQVGDKREAFPHAYALSGQVSEGLVSRGLFCYESLQCFINHRNVFFFFSQVLVMLNILDPNCFLWRSDLKRFDMENTIVDWCPTFVFAPSWYYSERAINHRLAAASLWCTPDDFGGFLDTWKPVWLLCIWLFIDSVTDSTLFLKLKCLVYASDLWYVELVG